MTYTSTENESAFLEIVRSADDQGKKLILTFLLCAVRFGEEFFCDIKAHKEGKAIIQIVESYASRLESEVLK